VIITDGQDSFNQMAIDGLIPVSNAESETPCERFSPRGTARQGGAGRYPAISTS